VLCSKPIWRRPRGTIPHVLEAHHRSLHRRRRLRANIDLAFGAGLAAEGKIPICASFTAFATRRDLERCRSDVLQRGVSEQQREDRRHVRRASRKARTAARTCASSIWPSMRTIDPMHVYVRPPTLEFAGDSCVTWHRHEAAESVNLCRCIRFQSRPASSTTITSSIRIRPS